MERPQGVVGLTAGPRARARRRIVGALLLLSAASSSVAWSQPQAVESLRRRVVRVSALEEGVGFVVGERSGRRWIVTANHVIRSEDGDVTSPVTVRFFDEPDRTFRATALPRGYVEKPQDLAVLTVDVPADLAALPAACAPRLRDYRLPVWLLGVEGTWAGSSEPGTVGSRRPNQDQLLAVTIDSVTPGTSGGPLVAAQGVVGMLLGNSPRGLREADALAIGFISDRFIEWDLPWSLLPCESAIGPERVSTRFPLLGEPPPELWRDDTARELFVAGKEALESDDFFCFLPPSFGLVWPLRPEDEVETSSEAEYKHALQVLDLLDRSLALEETRWTRLYRGLALSRIRAFQPAVEDVRSAYEDFRHAGEYAYGEVAARALELIERWRAEPVRRPDAAALPAECRRATSTTVCQLVTRIAPEEQAAVEPRRLVAEIERLLGGEPSAAPGFVAPAVDAQLECAFGFAERTENLDLSTAVFEFLLDQTRARGLAPLAAEYLRAFSRRLFAEGRAAEARSVLEGSWESLEERQRVALLVEMALDPTVPQATFEALLARGGQGNLGSKLRSLREEASELRTLLESLSEAIARAAEREAQGWYFDLIRYLEEATSWSTEKVVSRLPDEGTRGATIASLLAAARADLGLPWDALAARADALLAELDGIAREPLSRAELRTIHERTVTWRDDLLEALGAAGDPALTAAGATGLVAGVSSLLGLDVQLLGEAEGDLDLIAWGLDLRWASHKTEAVLGYRHAAYLLRVLVLGVLPADSRAVSMMTAVGTNLGIASLEGVLEDLEALEECGEAEAVEQRRSCVGRVLSSVLDAARGAEVFEMFAAPILQAHGEAQDAILDALQEGETRDPDSLYLERLVAELSERGSMPEIARLPAVNQLALVGLAELLKDLGDDLDLDLRPAAVDVTALEREVRELLVGVRLLAIDVLESPDPVVVERAARQARILLGRSTLPTVKVLILASPFTYRGLSPARIESLLKRVEQSGLDPELVRLALSFAIFLASEDEGAGALGYEELKVLGRHVDDDRYGSLAAWWPLSGELARFSGAIEPLTARETWDQCDGGELGFGVEATSLAPLYRLRLSGTLQCKCCVHPAWTTPLLMAKATEEERWQELDEMLRDVERRAEDEAGWWSEIGPAMLDLLASEPEAPEPLVDSELRLLLRPEVRDALSLPERLVQTATLVELAEERPELPSLPPREEVHASLHAVGDLVWADLSWDGELTMESLFEFSDRLAAPIERLGDAVLEWEWTRQTEDIRWLAAELVRLREERADLQDDQIGIGGQSVVELLGWLQALAAARDPRATTHLGWIHGSLDEPWAGGMSVVFREAETGDREAIALLTAAGPRDERAVSAFLISQAAEAGDREAMALLGTLYARGRGVPADPELARGWLEKAVERGSTEAMIRLGEISLRGWGVPPDEAEARRWFLAAAEAGNPEGMFQVALIDLMADRPEDRASGLRWLRRAAEAGHPLAIETEGALLRPRA